MKNPPSPDRTSQRASRLGQRNRRALRAAGESVTLDQERRLLTEEWYAERSGPFQQPHAVFAMHLAPATQFQVIGRALDMLGRRHDAFRTVFDRVSESPHTERRRLVNNAIDSGVPPVRLYSRRTAGFSSFPLSCEHLDVPALTLADPFVMRRVLGEAMQPFDLTTPPLARAMLIGAPNGEKILTLSVDRLIADWYSMGALADELASLLDGAAHQVPAAVRAEDAWPRRASQTRSLSYWRDHWGKPDLVPLACHDLLSALPPTNLPPAFGFCAISVPAKTTGAIRRWAAEHGVTLEALVVGVTATVLSHDTHKSSLPIWMEFRSAPRRRQSSVGPLSTAHLVDIDLDGSTSLEHVVASAHRTLVAARTFSNVCLEQVWRAMGIYRPQRSTVAIGFRHLDARTGKGHPSTLRAYPVMTTDVGLGLQIASFDDGHCLSVSAAFLQSHFALTVVAELLADISELLHLAVASPEGGTSGSQTGPASGAGQRGAEQHLMAADSATCLLCRQRRLRRAL